MAPAAIRYKQLGYVALNVSDLEASERFYRDVVGLTPVETDLPDSALFRCSASHHDIMLTQGGAPGLKRVAWWMESAAALASVRDHLRSLGLPVLPVPAAEAMALGIRDAFRSVVPTLGATFEFFVDMADADGPYVPTHTKIERLGHLVMNSPDRAASEAFLLEELNFRASDRIEGAVTFMRCFPNPLHHSLGLGGSPDGKGRLHHVNFMVTEIDDIGKAIYRVKANDVPIVFGPGRHPPSESVFLYFLDPDRLTIEYSYGMEEFPEVGAREPRLMPMGIQSIDYWGGAPSSGMASIGAVEQIALETSK